MGLPSETFKQPGIRDLVAVAIQDSFSRVAFDASQWAAEVRALAQAAAIEGDYSHAIECYKMLGRHLGVNLDQKQADSQHVHLHGSMDEYDRREASDAELQARLQEIREASAKLVDVEPEPVAAAADEDLFFEA